MLVNVLVWTNKNTQIELKQSEQKFGELQTGGGPPYTILSPYRRL